MSGVWLHEADQIEFSEGTGGPIHGRCAWLDRRRPACWFGRPRRKASGRSVQRRKASVE